MSWHHPRLHFKGKHLEIPVDAELTESVRPKGSVAVLCFPVIFDLASECVKVGQYLPSTFCYQNESIFYTKIDAFLAVSGIKYR